MENKYYTPTIEEFHVGFECEAQGLKDNEVVWETITPMNTDALIMFDRMTLRVKYLDKEDIESLGWKGNGNSYLHSEGKFRLVIESFDSYQTILIETLGGLKYYGYLESIKNKSELKKLMKHLGIYE